MTTQLLSFFRKKGTANLARSESEKRAKSAAATAAGDDKLGRSKSVKVNPNPSPTPSDTKLPTFHSLHLVNEHENGSDKETSKLQNGEERCSQVEDMEKYASLFIINFLQLIYKQFTLFRF